MDYLVHKRKLEQHGIVDTLFIQIIALLVIRQLITFRWNRVFIQHLS